MIKFPGSFLLSILIVAVLGCKRDKPEETDTPSITTGQGGVYVTNEGNFQFGNSSVSYYDPNSGNVTKDLFSSVNNRPLGDVCQSIYKFNGKFFLVVNNSGKIEVVNATNFSSSSTISGFTSPRYFLPVSNNKAYVTDYASGKIWIVDLASNSISGSIICPGWTEEMHLSYGKVWVTNQKRDKVYIVDAQTDFLIDSVAVGFAGNSIREDKFGKLWVLCSGNSSTGLVASLHKIDPFLRIVEKTFSFAGNDSPFRLNMNTGNDTLYYLNRGVFKMSINEINLPSNAFIAQGNKNFYSLGVAPSGEIYVGDAIDYVQRGKIYRYSSTGIEITSFLADIIPGNFYFD